MAVDWETIRANRAYQRDLDAFDARANKQVAADKEAYLKSREREAHQAELASFISFANARAAEASKRRDADDERIWLIAASNAKAGKWLVHRLIGTDPRITAHQGLRARLCCEGATAQIEE